MPRFSAFTPFSQLAFSSAPSVLQSIYELLPSLWGAQHDMTQVGTYEEAKRYAVARTFALVSVEHRKAGNQIDPTKAWDLLPLLENDFLISPGPSDGIVARQNVVAAAMLLPAGAKVSNVVNSLRKIVGAVAFLAYVPNPAGHDNQTVFPAAPGAGPGAFKDVRQPAKFLQLVDPVALLGSGWCAYKALDLTTLPTITWSPGATFAVGQTVLPTLAAATGLIYACSAAGSAGSTEPAWPTVVGDTIVDGSVTWRCVSTAAPALKVGDVVVVDAGNTNRMEKVTVTGVENTLPVAFNCTPGPTNLFFEATFTKAHDVGATLTTGQVPYWWSTQRLNLIVLGAGAAIDQLTRLKVDRLMGKVLRAVDQWAIVQPSSTTALGGTVGPLSAGAPMGCVPIGSIAFTNSN